VIAAIAWAPIMPDEHCIDRVMQRVDRQPSDGGKRQPNDSSPDVGRCEIEGGREASPRWIRRCRR